MDLKEAELISRSQQGDQDALKEIFDQYRTKVYRIAYGVVRQREDALDIVQEVFIKLFRSMKNFKGRSNLYTYLYRIAMNTAIDYTRKMKKYPTSNFDDERGLFSSDDLGKRPEKILIDKELEERLKTAMEKLPSNQKASLILREVEDLSYQEIAEVTGCSIGTVMSRLHYGRKKLRELLKNYVKESGEE